MMKLWTILIGLTIGCCTAFAGSFNRTHNFVNLTQEELRIDSILPYYSTSIDLGKNYADSTYTINVEYPEFQSLTKEEILWLSELLSSSQITIEDNQPKISKNISIERKCAQLNVGFIPIVQHDGEYKKLVSFKLNITASPRINNKPTKTLSPRYVAHSVLSSGKWVKIRVPSTGYYQLTVADIESIGFKDISKVKVFGYGGAAQPDVLTDSYLRETDDLKEIPTFYSSGRKVFFAQGPATWESKESIRKFNQFSSFGYYFLTEGDSSLVISAEEMKNMYYPADIDYHTLYEKDEVSWYHGGRNLYENTFLTANATKYTISTPGHCSKGSVTISITASAKSTAQIVFNDSMACLLNIPSPAAYSMAAEQTITFNVDNIKPSNTIAISNKSGCDMRLDYICINYAEPTPMPDLSAMLPTPEYVAYIDNQDLHADSCVQMVIIVPQSGKMDFAASRLKEIHEDKDKMSVKVVHDYELYHEFSSGTPDANAYRRYLKMLYDRAGNNEESMPRFLLLLGDCAWDNRMISNEWKLCDPHDYLLCYESENSFSDTECYVMEDYFGLLDDGEGGAHTASDKPDIGIGRICATTAEDANYQVDKIVSYIKNANAGDWQNTMCFIGDDGNGNSHMSQAEQVAQQTEHLYPGFDIKRIFIEAYNRETSAIGNTYPDVTRLLREQMSSGALLMNYTGHGSAYQFSHERVLTLSDFADNKTKHLPVWFTASCDIMPIDTKIENFGKVSMSNPKGGAVAFVGTTRTVFSFENSKINLLFSKYVLAEENGRCLTLGEALRKAKNDLVTLGQDLSENKLHYVLLGDPAMSLARPIGRIVVDSINGMLADDLSHVIPAGSVVDLNGHVVSTSSTGSNFNGRVSLTVKDAQEYILCHNYDTYDKSDRFAYYDRKNTLFNGSDSVRNNKFNIRFSVPMDIKYDSAEGLLTLYACSNDNSQLAHGSYEHVVFNNTMPQENDSIGPSISCYLNSPSFANGDKVNSKPFFVAQLVDKDGINVSGSSIGHDLALVIDGKSDMTYNLNSYFQYDFGSYTSGRVEYSLPELSEGRHKLQFKAWDILNNSSTSELVFNVVNGLEPVISDIGCSHNPANTYTDFIIKYDRAGTAVDITFEVYDVQGRIVWRNKETGVNTQGEYRMHWGLISNAGSSVSSGLYLYRARISCGGSSEALKAKKLLIYRK